jgi:hypothetical protein
MSDRQPDHFEFLLLPKELRLMVYCSIEVYTQHRKIYGAPVVWNGQPAQASATLIVKGLPIQLLATCHLIHDEAECFLRPKVESLRQEVPRIIVESGACDTIKYLIQDSVTWMRALQLAGDGAEFLNCLGERTANTAEPEDAPLDMDDHEGKRMFIRKTGAAFAWQCQHLHTFHPNTLWVARNPNGFPSDITYTYFAVRFTTSPWHISDRRPEWQMDGPIQLFRETMRNVGLTSAYMFKHQEGKDAKIIAGWQMRKQTTEAPKLLEGDIWAELQLEGGWELGESPE